VTAAGGEPLGDRSSEAPPRAGDDRDVQTRVAS
jgi:hypothetical protein